MRVLAAVLAMAAMVSLPCLGRAQTTYTLYPQEDGWVNEANPTANYGNATYLSVKDRSGLAEAYMRFSDADLAGLRGQDIASASLFLYQYQGTYSPGDSLNLHKVTTGWQEATLVWNNRPGYEAAPISALILSDGNLQWRQWQGLEGCVGSWLDGNNFGLALENGMDGAEEELFARFYSSEYADSSLRPYLRVTTTPEPVSATLFLLGSGVLSFVPALCRKRSGGLLPKDTETKSRGA